MRALVVLGVYAVVGLIISFFEEIGWTGFATHELRKRHGLLATGLIVGLPWVVPHLPFYAETASGTVPPALEVAAIFFYFVPYRMLMVWVYDHTQSVLLAILMHLPLIVFLFNLLVPAMAAVPELIFNLVFGATLWSSWPRSQRPTAEGFRDASLINLVPSPGSAMSARASSSSGVGVLGGEDLVARIWTAG